jgi:hypothetical protein
MLAGGSIMVPKLHSSRNFEQARDGEVDHDRRSGGDSATIESPFNKMEEILICEPSITIFSTKKMFKRQQTERRREEEAK